MKSHYNRPETYSNARIYKLLMEMKSEIDTIIEMKNLDEDHELCFVSNTLEKVLDSMDQKFPNLGKELMELYAQEAIFR